MYGFREEFRRLVKEMDNRISYYIKFYCIFPLSAFSLYMRWSSKWVSRLSSRYDGLFGNSPGSVRFCVSDAPPANNRGTTFARIEGCCYGLQLFHGFKARRDFYQSNLYTIIIIIMLVLDGLMDTLQISSNSRPVISRISRLQIFAIFMQVHISKNATEKKVVGELILSTMEDIIYMCIILLKT